MKRLFYILPLAAFLIIGVYLAIGLTLDAWVDGEELAVQARVSNDGAGHAFPTGVSIRNAVLVVEARVDGQPLAQVGGPVVPFYGSAAGGTTPEDLAGRPGRGFARVLEGRINGSGPMEYRADSHDFQAANSGETRVQLDTTGGAIHATGPVCAGRS